MGFAWMSEGGRQGSGRMTVDADVYDDVDWPRRGGVADHRQGLGSRREARRQAARPGRHAQPKTHRPILGGLAVVAIHPRAMVRRDQTRRAGLSRGAHAAHRIDASRRSA
jgi:hypothetical protein